MLYLVSSINSIQITSNIRYVMSEHILVQSFELDGSSSTCGVPICASGKQPQVQQPDVYPDHLKTFVDQRELNSYFKKINSIFYVSHPRQDFHHFLSLCQRTGFPKCPTLVLLPVSFLPTVILLSWSELELEGWAIVYFLPAGLGLSVLLGKFSLEKLFDHHNKI